MVHVLPNLCFELVALCLLFSMANIMVHILPTDTLVVGTVEN